MTDTLKDLQKKIYSRDKEIAKLQAQESELRQKIKDAQKEGKSEKDIINLNVKAQERAAAKVKKMEKQEKAQDFLEKKLAALQEVVNGNRSLPIPKEVARAQEEITDYASYRTKVALNMAEVQVAEQAKRDRAQKAKKEQQEKIYREQKATILNSFSGILKDPRGLRDILNPLAAKGSEKKAEGIGALAKFKAGAEGLAFAASHAGSLLDIIGSRKFYAVEAQKMMRIINQEEEYDPQNPPFFMRLLGDKEVRTFLNQQGPKIIHLVEVLAPLIAPIVLKELGKVDAIAEEVKDKTKALGALPVKEAELQKLKSADVAGDKKRIGELEKEIAPLKDLQNRERVAKAISKLKAQGLGDEFITMQLLPIIVETFKELLAKPEDVVDLASAAIDFARASEQTDKKAALQKIFDSFDINRLLQNGKLAEFLRSQGTALSEIITTLMDASPEISAKMVDIGLGKEAVVGAVQAFAPIVGEVLKAPDPEVINRLKGAIADIALGDLEEQKRKAESLEDLARLDKAQTAQKLKVAKTLPDLLLKGDIASLALRNIPDFLRKNQATMEQVMPKIWPVIIAKIEDGLEASLLQYNPNLDKAAAKRIILPPLELLKVTDPALIQKLIPVIIGFVDGLTNDVSQESLRAIYQDITLLTSKAISPEDGDAAQKHLIAEVLKLMDSKKMALALRAFGEFLGNAENVPAVTAIAKRAIEDNPTLGTLRLPDSLVESTISLVAVLANGTLAGGDQFAPIARSFLQYRDAEQGTVEQYNSLVAMGAAGLTIMTNLSQGLKDDLATYLHENKQYLAEAASSAVPGVGALATLMPTALELVANALPLAVDSAVTLLSKGEALARMASDFSRYQMRGRQLEEGGLRHEVQLEFMESRRNLFNNLVNQGLNLVNSEEVTKLFKTDVPQFLSDNQSQITELAVKAMENPEINRLNVSSVLVRAAVPLVTKVTAALLSGTPELTKLVREAHELITAGSGDRPQKVEAVVNSILALKENNKDLNDLIEKEIPQLLTKHSEELGGIVDTFLKQTRIGKALNSRGRQIVEVAGKKLPVVQELAESYAKGDRVSLIPKALKLLFNKDVLRLVVDIAGDMVRDVWQKSIGLDNADVGRTESGPANIISKQKRDKPDIQLPPQDQQRLQWVVGELQASGAIRANEASGNRTAVATGTSVQPERVMRKI